ncbi:MAG: VOC family protein [Bacteroidetes bacterium]|jgi:catechol 2,3-dioxygenase-like lactoylglutathione lyase family enzyme|nr:VOC family protein [Bacteroidota bacterium]
MESEQPNIQYSTPLFMVSNMEASLKFYVDGLGFKIMNTWTPRGTIEWCWLQREGGSIMLQEVRMTTDKSYLAGNKPGAGVSIWFQCRDSLVLYHEFLDNGIKPDEPFVGNGLWDVRIVDPDGYYLHFESKTDVPEETRYSEWVKGN